MALLFKRGIEFVIAAYAVMKTGATFIPLDYAYPQARIDFILQYSKAALVLTTHDLLVQSVSDDVPVTCLDQFNFNQWSSNSVNIAVDPSDLVYVIFTSGSTGKPKGVMIEQAGFSHYVQWADQFYETSKGYGAPVHSSLAFDLTLTCIFVPLVAGKTIDMIGEEDAIGDLIACLKQRDDYSILKITPAHLKILQDAVPSEQLQRFIATVVIGGEALYFDDLSNWYALSKKVRFINEYGAPETSVANVIHEV